MLFPIEYILFNFTFITIFHKCRPAQVVLLQSQKEKIILNKIGPEHPITRGLVYGHRAQTLRARHSTCTWVIGTDGPVCVRNKSFTPSLTLFILMCQLTCHFVSRSPSVCLVVQGALDLHHNQTDGRSVFLKHSLFFRDISRGVSLGEARDHTMVPAWDLF